MNDRRSQTEQWLEVGLKHYTDVDPGMGLENRLLAAIRAEPQLSRVWKWQGMLAMAVALVVVGAVLSLVNRSRAPGISPASRPSSAFNQSTVRGEVPSNARARGLPSRPMHKVHRALASLPVVQSEEPRLEQFPSPQPLNNQEATLLRYVRQRRREAVMVARARAELENRKFLSSTQLPVVADLPGQREWIQTKER